MGEEMSCLAISFRITLPDSSSKQAHARTDQVSVSVVNQWAGIRAAGELGEAPSLHDRGIFPTVGDQPCLFILPVNQHPLILADGSRAAPSRPFPRWFHPRGRQGRPPCRRCRQSSLSPEPSKGWGRRTFRIPLCSSKPTFPSHDGKPGGCPPRR